MTETVPETAADRLRAYLDAYPAASCLPESESDILDAIAGADLRATDLRAVLARLATLEAHTPAARSTDRDGTGFSLEWSVRSSRDETTFPTKEAALKHFAYSNGYNGGDDDVAWRYAGRWQSGEIEPRPEDEQLCQAREVLAEIERRALAAEKAGDAAEYCALWGVHGLLADVLSAGTDAEEAR